MQCPYLHNQCLNIKKPTVHNIHRIAWGPNAHVPSVKTTEACHPLKILYIKYLLKYLSHPKTEGARAIKNWQTRDLDNIGHRMKTNKKKTWHSLLFLAQKCFRCGILYHVLFQYYLFFKSLWMTNLPLKITKISDLKK
jgi:hypothetical protein